MTEPPRTDEELVSAVLDGEATAEERARVDADPALTRRLAEFHSVSRLVGGPVEPAGQAAREESIARALQSADDLSGTGGDDVVGIDRAAGRRRMDPNRRVLMAAAAVIGVLALAGALLALGGGDDAQDEAAGTADETDVAAGDVAVPELDLGDIDDVETLRLRINETTGLGTTSSPDAEAFAEADGDDVPSATEETPIDRGSSVPSTGADAIAALDGEDYAIELVESRPGLVGQLAEGSVTYQGVDAYVFVYNDIDVGGAVGIVTATVDCRVLAEVPL